MRPSSTRTFAFLMLAPVLVLTACAPKAEDIERWKGTQKGPGKLKDAVAQASLSDDLRGQAAVALFEIGEGQNAVAALEKQPPERRAAAVTVAITILEKQLGAEGAKATTAKDALFSLRALASPADQKKIDQLLVAWLVKDLTPRLNQGGHAGEKILMTAGPVAAVALGPLCQAGSPQLGIVTSLLGRIDDKAAREKCAETLVTAAERATGGDVPQPILQAIAQVGGPRAGEFLVAVAESPRRDVVRANALVALINAPADSRTEKVLAGLGRIALDKKAPGKAREAAFNVAEKFGPIAVPTLVKLVDQPEETLRWRAVEAALLAGNESAIEPTLRALPAAAKYKLEDLDSYVVHDMRRIGDKAVPKLTALVSDAAASPVTKIAALRALAAIGKAANTAACKPLTADTAPQKNFTPPTSVGKEAEGAIAALQKRP